MNAPVTISVNGRDVQVPEGISVAAAIATAGAPFRRSLTGEHRAPLCGMGVCFECRATVDGVAQQRTCLIPVRAGLRVEIDDPESGG
ncbi:MAG: (2Fe-2S)-binding protein [Burkholderiaceae bacterium]|nr:MAG: (2Fe-2S)-binding protein [Burkholderiaceae bacterium]